jgi:hypothetical protein
MSPYFIALQLGQSHTGVRRGAGRGRPVPNRLSDLRSHLVASSGLHAVGCPCPARTPSSCRHNPTLGAGPGVSPSPQGEIDRRNGALSQSAGWRRIAKSGSRTRFLTSGSRDLPSLTLCLSNTTRSVARSSARCWLQIGGFLRFATVFVGPARGPLPAREFGRLDRVGYRYVRFGTSESTGQTGVLHRLVPLVRTLVDRASGRDSVRGRRRQAMSSESSTGGRDLSGCSLPE